MTECTDTEEEECTWPEGVLAAKRVLIVDDTGQMAEITAASVGAGTCNIEIVTELPEYPSVDTLYLVGVQKEDQDNPNELLLTEIHAWDSEGHHISRVFTDSDGSSSELIAYKCVAEIPEAADMNATQVYCELEDFDPDDYPSNPNEPTITAWCAVDVLPEAADLDGVRIYMEVSDYDIQDACAA